MSCANHPQNPVAAYCRTCGKPLCSNCTRQVMGVVYCENCLAERVSGSAPPPRPYQPFPGYSQVLPGPAGPNPGLAGFLGAIPFGVGAIYNGQYTKGLVHLGIFVALIVGLSSNLPYYGYIILGIGMGFFVLYQVMDAVHTARAIQSGRPAPDPFGLNEMFNPGGTAPSSSYENRNFVKNVPTGAIVLILLGILFLLHNLDVWFLQPGILFPLLLIGLGVWLLARQGQAPGGLAGRGGRGLMAPAVLMTLGGQSLLENLGIVSFGKTLPVLLIVIGVVLAIQRSARLHTGYPPSSPAASPPPQAGPTASSEVPPSEVKNG